MKTNWILISALSGAIAGVITYFVTGNWTISLISAIIVAVLVLLNNPNRRYMRAFYIVLLPLLSNIYFTISTKTKNVDLEAGLEELDTATIIVLGIIALACLVLDYLERSGKLSGTLLEISRNTNKNVSGNNITINQSINEKSSSSDD